MQDKITEAKEVLSRCRTDSGFYASPDRYYEEYWTRDLAYSTNGLIKAGYRKEVRAHLANIWNYQDHSGAVPRFFVKSKLNRAFKKLMSKIEGREVFFSLRSFRTTENIFNKWTIDSTPLAIIATYNYVKRTKDYLFFSLVKEKLAKAMKYVEKHTKNGFLMGGDWRDSLPELKNEYLLSNNVILYRLLKFGEDKKQAEKLKRRINSEFWNGHYYVDNLNGKNFDTLGTSMAIIEGVVPRERYKFIRKKFEEISSKYGLLNMLYVDAKARELSRIENCDQVYAIWPFVSVHAIIAMRKMNAYELAKRELQKLNNLKGFYEWYDFTNGRPCGSSGQLWSAATYLTLFG
jgi:glycogen debranching enzyme